MSEMMNSQTGKADRTISPLGETLKVPTRSTAGINSKITQSTTIAAEERQPKHKMSFTGKKINIMSPEQKLESADDNCCHIELDIDTADAFDYEDVKNAKYSVG